MVRNEDGEIVERFNPSQVGYKLVVRNEDGEIVERFNPSQVGYKLPRPSRIRLQTRVSIPHR